MQVHKLLSLFNPANEALKPVPPLQNVSSSAKHGGGHIMSTKYNKDHPHQPHLPLGDQHRLGHVPQIAPITPHLPPENTYRLGQLPLVTPHLSLEDPHRSSHLTHGPPHLPAEDPLRLGHLTHGPPHLPAEDPLRLGHLPHVTPVELRYIRQARASDSYAYSVEAPSLIPPATQHPAEATRAYHVENPSRGERYVVTIISFCCFLQFIICICVLLVCLICRTSYFAYEILLTDYSYDRVQIEYGVSLYIVIFVFPFTIPKNKY